MAIIADFQSAPTTNLPPHLWLMRAFDDRRSRNPRFSLRAFANFLEIPSGRVSQLINRKRRFTMELGEKIANKLNLSPEEREVFLEQIHLSRGQKLQKSSHPKLKLKSQQFTLISEPYHFTLLSLMETHDFKSDPKWIARRLNLNPAQVTTALHNLEELNLIRCKNNQYKLIPSSGIKSSDGVVNPALRRAHKQILAQSIEKIDSVPIELRDVTSLALAIDPKKLPEAKKAIRRFKKDLEQMLESGDKSEVYRLNIQLLPESSHITGEKNL